MKDILKLLGGAAVVFLAACMLMWVALIFIIGVQINSQWWYFVPALWLILLACGAKTVKKKMAFGAIGLLFTLAALGF